MKPFTTRNKKHLSFITGLPLIVLNDIFDNPNNYFTPFTEPKLDKNGVQKVYSDGTIAKRSLNKVNPSLKRAQKNLLQNLFYKNDINVESMVLGGRKGTSNILCAKWHQGNKYKLKIDLRNFFDYCTCAMVKEALHNELNLSQYLSNLIAKLTTVKGKLPQGAPTSPFLAILIFLPIDRELTLFCNSRNIKYSRYIDDLVFSGPYNFCDDISIILDKVRSFGFQLSHRKIEFNPRIEVNGVLVNNNSISPPAHIQNRFDLDIQSRKKSAISNYVSRINRASIEKFGKVL